MTTVLARGVTLKDTTGNGVDLVIQSRSMVDGHVKVYDKKLRQERFEDYESLRQRVASGTLVIDKPNRPSLRVQISTTKADDDALLRAKELVARLRQRMKRYQVSASKAYDMLVEDNEALPEAEQREDLPSKATIFRWLARDRDGKPLLTPNSAKGNRTCRHSDELCEFILDEAERDYLAPQSTCTLGRFIADVTAHARDAELLAKDSHLSRQFISRLIHDYKCTDVDEARMDPKDRASGKSIGRHTIRLAMPMQRVEQDALHLPFIVKTPSGISATVYLIHAIECYLSVPVGWNLIIGHPVESDSLKCVERILFPKQPDLDQLGVTSPIDLYGLVGTIIYDNGPETKGERMKSLTRLGMDTMHCKSRHAHGKPFIERLNRSLKEALETLPGCTRFNGKDGVRNPIALGDKLMDVHELEQWIVRWYYEKWIHTKLRRFQRRVFGAGFAGFTPLDVWTRKVIEDQWAMPLPPNRADWEMLKYERISCTLSRKTGITYGTFNFAGDNLTRLIKEHGETLVTVLIDPDDFRHVDVLSVNETELVRLINKDVDENTPAFSFAQAKKMSAELRKLANARPEPEPSVEFSRDIYKRSAGAAKPVDAKPKRMTRAVTKDTTRRAKEDAAVTRATLSPLSASECVPRADSPAGTVVWSTKPAGLYTVIDQVPTSKPLKPESE
ncbi:MAG: hypothetical protein IPG93_10195 [Burkholderiales bacterium]|nr:hypothetical protein [Burkholderiales bacterium]